jgi:tetratricopeptide (TPR) repeat protein
MTGQYKKGVEEGKEAIRLSPDFSASYAFPIFDYIALNRLDEAKATYRQAFERKLKHASFALSLYLIAFLQNDRVGMQQQVAATGVEDTLLANKADTAAFFGRLKELPDLYRLSALPLHQ